MDKTFHPAIEAIKTGNTDRLKALVQQDPSLATSRSSTSHPTLLQCLALDATQVPNKVEMARVFVDAGAEVDGPLSACASIDNVEVAAALLDWGASINGNGGWSPLEEALYWRNQGVIDLLVDRGASVHNLRIAAGLGRTDLIESFFDKDALKPEAGTIDWPFGDPLTSNLATPAKEHLKKNVEGWSLRPIDIINNALIYACINNHLEAVKLLLKKGAEVNAIPPGFDYAGTALHNAAVQGNKGIVEFLIQQGADATVLDTKVKSTAAGWADHGGHIQLRDLLELTAKNQAEKRTQDH